MVILNELGFAFFWFHFFLCGGGQLGGLVFCVGKFWREKEAGEGRLGRIPKQDGGRVVVLK